MPDRFGEVVAVRQGDAQAPDGATRDPISMSSLILRLNRSERAMLSLMLSDKRLLYLSEANTSCRCICCRSY
jgi:hypothetical protein